MIFGDTVKAVRLVRSVIGGIAGLARTSEGCVPRLMQHAEQTRSFGVDILRDSSGFVGLNGN